MKVDVIIVGAGPVGLSIACALQKTSLKIALLDKQSFEPPIVSKQYDDRVYAINQASQRFWEASDVWSHMSRQRVSPYHEMRIWEGTGTGSLHFSAKKNHVNELGHIIEASVIRSSLLASLDKTALQIYGEKQLTGLTHVNGSHTVHCDDGTTLTGKLVIAADGAKSWLRQHAGLSITAKPYDQVAIVATVKHALPHQKTAWQIFWPSGPLAFLPLLDSYHSSIVWTTSIDHAQILMNQEPNAFNQALCKTSQRVLGDSELISKRYHFPLVQQYASHWVKAGIALVGDAAHTLHPLAGQGMNLGLADANALVHTLKTAITGRRDFSAYDTLRRYERARKGQTLAMMKAMYGLNALFAIEQESIKYIRNIGLKATNRCEWLKRVLVRRAMS